MTTDDKKRLRTELQHIGEETRKSGYNPTRSSISRTASLTNLSPDTFSPGIRQMASLASGKRSASTSRSKTSRGAIATCSHPKLAKRPGSAWPPWDSMCRTSGRIRC